MSDGLLGFEVRGRTSYTHKTVLAPKGKAGTEIGPFKWLNVLIGNLRTALSGTHPSCFQIRQVHPSLPGGRGVGLQPAFRFGRDGAEAGVCRRAIASMFQEEDRPPQHLRPARRAWRIKVGGMVPASEENLRTSCARCWPVASHRKWSNE